MVANSYLLCFFGSVTLSLILTRWVRNFATVRGWVSAPQLDRHVHINSVPRLGGIAIFASFTTIAGVALLFSRWTGLAMDIPLRTIECIFAAVVLIFLLGLYDDVRPVAPQWKFGIQALAAVVLYSGGIGVHQLDLFPVGVALGHLLSLPLTVLWVLLITNAFNLIDGLDGLAAGSALFSAVVVFVTSLRAHNVTVTLLAVALGGVILGFLRFNFHPASIFLGDSGSMFIGFTLATLALAGSQKAPTMIAVAIPVVSFGFPLLDVALALSRRFLSGKSLFVGDRDHIHHRLLKRGLSQRNAVLVLYAVAATFALLSLILIHAAVMTAFVLSLIGIGVVLGVQYLGYPEFTELQGALRRTAERRHAIANNVAVRHAVESLNLCADFGSLYTIVKNTLESIGFDGFRLGAPWTEGFLESSLLPVKLTVDGELQTLWCDAETESLWELRLDLNSGAHNRLGHFTFLRAGFDSHLLVDINLLTCDFRLALSSALLRAMHGNQFSVTRLSVEKVQAAKAASASSSD